MYSRYIPNGNGGFERRIVDFPSPAPPQGPGASPPFPPAGKGPGPPGPADRPPAPGPQAGPFPQQRPVPQPGSRPQPGPFLRPLPPDRPPQGVPGPPRPSGFGALSALLGRIDTEDLLILAILVLLMKKDGADPMTIAIAAGLYLFLK